jgi:hypothetical protein
MKFKREQNGTEKIQIYMNKSKNLQNLTKVDEIIIQNCCINAMV